MEITPVLVWWQSSGPLRAETEDVLERKWTSYFCPSSQTRS